MESGTSQTLELDHGARADTLQRDIQTLLSAQTPEDCFKHLCTYVGRFGFDKIIAGQVFAISDADSTNRRFFFQKGAGEFLSLYMKRNYQFSDPVSFRAMTTHRPFRWRETHTDMTKRQMEQMEAAKRFGMNYGIVFPIKDRTATMGFVSIGRATDFELSQSEFLELEMLCRYGYMSIDSHFENKEAASDMTLTPRETAILVHVSRGKTNWETGQILGISEYSVRDYLKSLSARLETSNRTHTVVRAIQLGLILP